MIEYLRDMVSKGKPGDKYGKFGLSKYISTAVFISIYKLKMVPVLGSYALQFADDFTYIDPVSSSTSEDTYHL